MLVASGCPHVEDTKELELGSASELGEPSKKLSKLVRNFLKSYWTKFGCADARAMAETRRAEVCVCQSLTPCLVYLLLLLVLFSTFDLLISDL